MAWDARGWAHGRHPPPDADDLFCDAVCTVVLAALERIGGNQEARFALFKKLLVAAQEAAGERDS